MIYILNFNKRIKNNSTYDYMRAFANIKGNKENNQLIGKVVFYQKGEWVIVRIELKGLPNKQKNNFFGFHIHEFGICEKVSGNETFLDTGAHFDLEKNTHPNHTGDMPSIYSNDGYAYMEFYTNRFMVKDIIGKSVIIHEKEDDFKTNPSGNSGSRIACGIIVKSI